MLALLVLGCGTKPGEAAWAFDPIALSPDGPFAVEGFQTWEVYDERWDGRTEADKHFVCVVVIRFEGAPGPGCDTCTESWSVTPEVVESDCDDLWLRQQDFPESLRGLGIGPADAGEDAPQPGATWEGWIDEGFGWQRHGWAWPKLVEDGGTQARPGWNGEDDFTLWPSTAWSLE
jgi:hypothetical protein